MEGGFWGCCMCVLSEAWEGPHGDNGREVLLGRRPTGDSQRASPSPAWAWALATPSAASSPCRSPHRADPASSPPGHAWPGATLSCPWRLQTGTLGSPRLSSQDRGSPSSDSLCPLRPHSQPFPSSYCVPGPGLGARVPACLQIPEESEHGFKETEE